MFRTQFAMCSPPGLQVKLRETSPRKTVPVFRKRGLARTVPHATWPLLPYGSILVHPCVVLPLVQEKTLKTNKQMVTLCTSPSFWDFQQPVSSRCHRCWASQLPFLQLQLCVQFLHLSLRDPLREQSKMAKKSPCLVQFKILKDRITPTGATSSNRNRSSSGTGKGGKTKEVVEGW